MKKCALVVDSEPEMCQIIREVLLSTGIEAVTQAKSAEAPDHLQGQKFDVILVDWSAQSSDGFELTRKIRGSGFNSMTPIVIIGDQGNRDSLTRGFNAGASFLIYKPIDRVRLTRLIRVTQGAIEQERRRFRRVPLRTKVRLKFAGTEAEGETIDVSLNGTLVRVGRIFPAGSLVEVALFLESNAKPVVGLGSVRRVIGFDQMGIQLDRLSIAESRRLQEYLLPHVAR
jgi:DNA-binding response OmpR family regulator